MSGCNRSWCEGECEWETEFNGDRTRLHQRSWPTGVTVNQCENAPGPDDVVRIYVDDHRHARNGFAVGQVRALRVDLDAALAVLGAVHALSDRVPNGQPIQALR